MDYDFILFVHTGRVNFDFNQCSIFTECCFSFEKAFNGQMQFSPDSNHLVQNPTSKISHSSSLGDFPPTPQSFLENPVTWPHIGLKFNLHQLRKISTGFEMAVLPPKSFTCLQGVRENVLLMGKPWEKIFYWLINFTKCFIIKLL